MAWYSSAAGRPGHWGRSVVTKRVLPSDTCPLALLSAAVSDGRSILYPPCRDITACLEMVAQGWDVTQQHRGWDCCQILRSTHCSKVRGRERRKIWKPNQTQKQFYDWVKWLCVRFRWDRQCAESLASCAAGGVQLRALGSQQELCGAPHRGRVSL